MLANLDSYDLLIHIKVSQLLDNLVHIMEVLSFLRLTDTYYTDANIN